MIHFTIAYKYYNGRPEPSFLLGSVAPDAVLVRKKDTEGKIKSHLGRSLETDDYLNFMKSNYITNIKDRNYFNFLLGYIAHVFVDLKWADLKHQISYHDRSLKEQIWQEENQMDFHLYQNVDWREELVEAIKVSPIYELDQMYTLNELDEWRCKIFAWLDDSNNEPKIENEYITIDRVESFIKQVTKELSELIEELERFSIREKR
ncbi:zinc dependent phospholipase C family protein [Chengkuizengella sp. SCS-71B]|uniref:zinc dependent phospholipase C family protein n=1 Tax=Chengkuizengella sp. SCS-71B TaxID=3115290 RepID=UPI0032C239FD